MRLQQLSRAFLPLIGGRGIHCSRVLKRMDVPPPSSILNPLHHEEITLFGPGPTNTAPRVCHASSLQTFGIFNPPMVDLMKEVQEGLRYLFQTKNELTYVVNASGMAGMETALTNLLEPKDRLMSLTNGCWGGIAAEVGERCGEEIETCRGEGRERVRERERERGSIHCPTYKALGERQTS